MRQNKTVASTGDTLTGKFLTVSWTRETQYNKALNASSQDYKYPELRSPIFASKCGLPPFYEIPALDLERPNIVKHMSWSKDGTTLITVNDDFAVRMYVVPADIASDVSKKNAQTKLEEPQLMIPLNRIFRQNSILSHSVNPGFCLYDERSYSCGLNNILIAERQLPIKLVSLIPEESKSFSPVLGNYHFKDKENEKYFDSFSLNFVNNRNFLAGSKDQLGIFNLDYSEPVAHFKMPKLFQEFDYIVENNQLASTGRKAGIFGTIANCKSEPNCCYLGSYLNKFCVIDLNSQKLTTSKSFTPYCDGIGNGIYQIIESDNNNYVYLMTRRGNSIPILDKRMNYNVVDMLNEWQYSENQDMVGKPELTNQKCFGDLLANNQGFIVGNQFGQVKLWPDSAIGIGGKPEILMEPSCDVSSYSTVLRAIGSVSDAKYTKTTTIGSVQINPVWSDILAYSQGRRDVQTNYDDSSDDEEEIEKDVSAETCNGVKIAAFSA